jgi:hypothetical protein
MRVHTGISRDTKDLDLFLRRQDLERACAALGAAGFTTEITYSHWLAKVFCGDNFIDIIFNMANATAPIDDSWLAHAQASELLGVPILVMAPEEVISSKILVLDRGRYDGADVAHMIHACGASLDWHRIAARARDHWEVLLSHLVLFGYIYPGEKSHIPAGLLKELTSRLLSNSSPVDASRLCRGGMLSPTQYRIDLEQWGYQDARLPPWGVMTPEQVRGWTKGAEEGK